MKLSALLKYKNQLSKLVPLDTAGLVNDTLAPILHTVETSEIQFSNLTNKINNNYHKIIDTLVEFESDVDAIREELDTMISAAEYLYYQDSNELYNPTLQHITAESILTRTLSLSDDNKEYINSRLKAQGNWQYAGMIIRPGHEDWINHLVNYDPLYLVDQRSDLLEPAVLRFNDQYKRRLRTYVIKEDTGSAFLSEFPKGQFGICLVYNFFNYKPIEVLTQYLTELYDKLKPGGLLAMTFNNCDLPGGASLVEYKFMSYTPGHIIIDHAKKLGFTIEQNKQLDAACTWIELRKPGTLSSNKGGQSLAKILGKKTNSLYNEEQVQIIRQTAADLNIASIDELNQMSLEKIVEFIKQRTKQ